MAYGKYGGGSKNIVNKALGRIVGLLLSLFVFDKILGAVAPTAQASTYFGTAASITVQLLTPIGILGAFWIIWDALNKMGMM